ncbi:hypothetical protein PHYSODRAFT_335902 [Phytophthora sojae]|uniref:Uncharacterized protein n=1 Tax=Phytophthora sojae (strain P6497) TaxID=1094619 RepID=G4ZSL9_PHYSP|nr:hypothetical protein PHYSODRAFT_335902 [Phytophthora sojae]EGZ14241.1 hypothetical protein PHYSODRAFT_335902 [Phytophthora sojae]|eukprot:XP_009531670.1 hypothetical protein PHYSODRAFT_335902 [Phytophthora sojae]
MEAHRSTSELPSQTSSGTESSPAGTQASGALAPQSPQQEESASELHESPVCTPSRTDWQRNQKNRLRVTSPHVAAHAASDVSSESEEPDESNDEDWSTAESAEEDREVTGDSEGIEDDEQAEDQFDRG